MQHIVFMAIGKKSKRAFFSCLRQKKAIEKEYRWCKCTILLQHTLICEGIIRPDEHSPRYKIKIRYRFGSVPKVYVLEPDIQMNAKTHVYDDESLCLFFPKDHPWTDEKLISETIIPWTAEWLLYYELYLITGKWDGPEAEH